MNIEQDKLTFHENKTLASANGMPSKKDFAANDRSIIISERMKKLKLK